MLLSSTPLMASPSGLLILDNSSCITYCNTQASRTFGYALNELVVTALRVLVDFADYQEGKFNLQPELLNPKAFVRSCMEAVESNVFPKAIHAGASACYGKPFEPQVLLAAHSTMR